MRILLKTIITFLITIAIVYLYYGKFLTMNANIGNLWININIYYITALGMLLPLLFFSFKKSLKIPYGIVLVVLLFYLVIITFDALNNLANQSLTIYVLLLLANGFVVGRFVKKSAHRSEK